MSVLVGSTEIEEFAVFDTETDGTDIFENRIVTAFIGILNAKTGKVTESWSWLLNTGREIPKGASDVHGITTERMMAEGTDAATGVFEITQRLDILSKRGLPVVIYNAPFDLTLLAAEMHRYWPGAREVVPTFVVDPLVLDRSIDPFRKKTVADRTLTAVCGVYGVPVLENAHDAEADCIMAGQLAAKLLRHPKLANKYTIPEFMKKTRNSKFSQTKGLKEWWEKKARESFTEEERAEWQAKADSVIHFNWPIEDLPWVEKDEVTA